jgi:hypothetical protein
MGCGRRDTIDLSTVIEESKQIFLGIDAGGLDDLSAAVVLGRAKTIAL